MAASRSKKLRFSAEARKSTQEWRLITKNRMTPETNADDARE